MHISTDHVFDGDATQRRAEDDLPAPDSAYGRTKLAGEQAVLSQLPDTGYVVRTAWLFGEYGPNFIRTMLRLAASQPTVDVIMDQHGQPTWTRDVAGQLIALAYKEAASPPLTIRAAAAPQPRTRRALIWGCHPA